MFLALAALLNLVSFVAFVIVLVQLFRQKGLGMGIVGVICALYTYLWGWQNAERLDTSGEKVGLSYVGWMRLWTAAFVVGVVANFLAR